MHLKAYQLSVSEKTQLTKLATKINRYARSVSKKLAPGVVGKN